MEPYQNADYSLSMCKYLHFIWLFVQSSGRERDELGFPAFFQHIYPLGIEYSSLGNRESFFLLLWYETLNIISETLLNKIRPTASNEGCIQTKDQPHLNSLTVNMDWMHAVGKTTQLVQQWIKCWDSGQRPLVFKIELLKGLFCLIFAQRNCICLLICLVLTFYNRKI